MQTENKKKYILELNENQAVVLREALGEYFRIRMNQWNMLAESLTLQGIDISPEHPKHTENFERFLCKRDDVQLVFEDIPPHSRDFSHELGGHPIKEPKSLAQKIT